jgi:hypothetical protein
MDESNPIPETTTPPAEVGRDSRGRFGSGNKFAKGNPIARKVAQLRQTLVSAVSATDLRDVVKKLVAMAKDGDVQAIRLLLDRLLGPVLPADVQQDLADMKEQIQVSSQENPV